MRPQTGNGGCAVWGRSAGWERCGVRHRRERIIGASNGAVVASARRHFAEHPNLPDVVKEYLPFSLRPAAGRSIGAEDGQNGTLPTKTNIKAATASTAIAVPTMIEGLSGGFGLSGA